VKITELKDLEEDPGPVQGPGDAALALGLQRVKRGNIGLAADTAAYLHKQCEMLDLQMVNLHEQRVIQYNHLKRRELIDRLKVSLQILAIAFGALVVGLAGYAVLDASRSRALVIEPISATQSLAQRGLTSEVLAAQLLDKLRTMQARTDSARAPDTFTRNWGDDIEVEIPQTGVSISDLMRGLRRWLGHDTHITGETFQGDQGLSLTTRVGTLPGRTQSTSDGQLDTLMRKAAEAIYADTQPYRYSVYLSQNGRAAEAILTLQRVADRAAPAERAWALIGLGGLTGFLGDRQTSVTYTRAGLDLNPNLAAGWMVLKPAEEALGHDEAVLHAARQAERTIARRDRGGVTEAAARQGMIDARATVAESLGDFALAARLRQQGVRLQRYQFAASGASALGTIDRIKAHQTLDATIKGAADDVELPVYRARALGAVAEETGNWAAAVAAMERLQTTAGEPGVKYREQLWRTQVWPLLAYGYARSGQLPRAQELISRTPLDCYLCLRARGRIAALAGDRPGVDGWFSRAVRVAPSLPFAYAEWGRALAEAGNHRTAETKFRAARRRGPNWQDTLVWWGESLRQQGREAEANARFAAAAKLAPNWKSPPITPRRDAGD
jgi:tetratricopeptide (TPR) repeat protein